MTLLLTTFVLLAFIFGALSALFGGIPALLLFAPILPIFFILWDYRVGVVILMLITTFQNTPFLPSFTGFNITNYLTAMTLGSLILSVRFKRLPVAPFPRIIVWSYLLPVTLAALHGVPHLSELTPYMVHVMSSVYQSPKSYFSDLLIKPLFLLLLAWMLGTAMRNSQKPERFLIPLTIAPLLPALAILVYIGTHGFNLKLMASPQGRTFLSALGIFANNFGILLSTAFAILLFMLPSVKGWIRTGLVLSLGIVGAALILTFSRGSYMIALLAVAYFILHNRQVKVSLLILVVLSGLILPFGHAILRRVTTGFTPSASISTLSTREQITSGRIGLWRKLVPEILHHPLLGSGLGSTAWSEPALRGEITVNNPQNLYLDMLMDVGVVGTVLILSFYWFVLRSFYRLAHSETLLPVFSAVFRGAWIGLIGMLAAGMAYGNYITTPPQTYIWLMFGMALAFLDRSPSKPVPVTSGKQVCHQPLT